VLLPSWFHGVPVVACRMAKFDPERAYDLMGRCGVRNVFLPPTAAKLMRQVPKPKTVPALRTIASGGETLGAELLEWGRSTFNLAINEFYGQTECNLVVGNSSVLFPARPCSMGRPIPGHRVQVIGADGQVTKAANERLGWEREFRMPTPGVIVKGCLDDCSTCEPAREREIKLELDRKELENELLKRRIALLDKEQEYRCCPAGEQAQPADG